MKYYSVISSYDDKGRTRAHMGDVIERDKRPEPSCVSIRDRDIWTDWFDSEEEAEKFKKEANA